MQAHAHTYMDERGDYKSSSCILYRQDKKTNCSKTCVKCHSKIDKMKILVTNSSSMKVKCIAECSPRSILHYFWPAFSDNWSWKPICGLFEGGCFTPVLPYRWNKNGTNSLDCLPNQKLSKYMKFWYLSHQLKLRQGCAYTQPCQSHCSLHTQSINVDEHSEQNLDI